MLDRNYAFFFMGAKARMKWTIKFILTKNNWATTHQGHGKYFSSFVKRHFGTSVSVLGPRPVTST